MWFSLGTPASSTTKMGRHDIAEILLKLADWLFDQQHLPTTYWGGIPMCIICAPLFFILT
jgi:hypothetical protein